MAAMPQVTVKITSQAPLCTWELELARHSTTY